MEEGKIIEGKMEHGRVDIVLDIRVRELATTILTTTH